MRISDWSSDVCSSDLPGGTGPENAGPGDRLSGYRGGAGAGGGTLGGADMNAARRLIRALRDPASVAGLDSGQWTALIAAARAESLIGSLAHRLEGQSIPERIGRILEDARGDHAYARTQALWEAEMARRALAPLGVPVIILKGTAYVAS